MKAEYRTRLGRIAAGLTIFAMLTCSAWAAETVFNLEAGVTHLTLPAGTQSGAATHQYTVWGFGLAGQALSVPGPVLTVPPGNSLRINLTNTLPEPVSVMIPGQAMPLDGVNPAPQVVRNADNRIRSFTHETPPGQTVSYVWAHIKPGTYLYQTATHPAVQVQMGLYGAVTFNVGTREAYPGRRYEREVVLVYSELDPALHAAVEDGTYGTAAYPSTVNYQPKYFLINGKPFTDGTGPYASANVGDRVFIRFLNAGLKTRTPNFLSTYVRVIAEDGNLYTYPKTQYSMLLPAGKTQDVLFIPTAAQRYAIYDRAGGLTNPVGVPGGMLTYVDANAAPKELAAAATP